MKITGMKCLHINSLWCWNSIPLTGWGWKKYRNREAEIFCSSLIIPSKFDAFQQTAPSSASRMKMSKPCSGGLLAGFGADTKSSGTATITTIRKRPDLSQQRKIWRKIWDQLLIKGELNRPPAARPAWPVSTTQRKLLFSHKQLQTHLNKDGPSRENWKCVRLFGGSFALTNGRTCEEDLASNMNPHGALSHVQPSRSLSFRAKVLNILWKLLFFCQKIKSPLLIDTFVVFLTF